jgi:UV DNA damage repair endonuclease
MGMSRGEELLQKLQPELAEIGKVAKKIKRRKLQHCEEK